MVSFFLNLVKLLHAYWHGLRADEELRILLVILLTLLTSATIFYSNVEGWGVVDSLYFSVMTMSTIGHDGFVPSSDLSKIFTIIFLFLSIGIYITVLAKVVKVALDEKKEVRARKKQKKDAKKKAASAINIQKKKASSSDLSDRGEK